jgi:hypothetical protein
MPRKKIKVFHGVVNYGTQAYLFAKELRKKGFDALSVSNKDRFKREIDVEMLNGGNFVQKLIKHFWNLILKLYWFSKFNTFHFYFGTTLLPKQWDLPFYRLFGKKVFMHYLGHDVQLYKDSIEKYEVTNVRFYKGQEQALKSDTQKKKRLKYESKYVNKQIVCAPYLSEFVPKSCLLPLAIDVSSIEFCPKVAPKEEVVIMHAPTSRNNKGTSFILDTLKCLKNEGFKIKILLVENVSHKELIEKYKECDIFIDQILAGWYGTASIEAMAVGRPTVCFLRESYFQYIDYEKKIPIINAHPSTIYDVLKKLIQDKYFFPEIGKRSRGFVEDVHEVSKLTTKLISIYNE